MKPVRDSASVTDDLLSLTVRLGDPALDLVILGEGNTSELLPDGRLVVKASGVYMQHADRDAFVVVDVHELVELIEDATTTQADLTAALDGGEQDGARVRGSIETLIHASVRAFSPARFVAHTHPTSVVSLLASVQSEKAFESAAYSDEAVVLGRSLWVPYAPPGIELGRVFHGALRHHVERWGQVPSLVLLANHGIVAISETASGAEAVTLMAAKAARVRLGAYAAGGFAGLDAEHVDAYFAREDFAERRGNLSGARS